MPEQAYVPLNTGIPLICIASLEGKYGELSRLIQQGSDIEATNPNTNATALHLASQLDHGDLVRLLLQSGANYSAVDSLNETPLHNAAIIGNFEAVELLLRAGSSTAVRGRGGATPLHMAAWNGHVKTVSLLLDFDANASAVDDNEEVPLHVAASHGSGPDILQILLRAGADINALSRDGETPLLKADRYTDSVKYLLQEGADARIASPDGTTCLHKAAGSVEEHVQLILDLQAVDVNARTAGGLSPLHIAATKWYITGVLPLLLDAGADINATSSDGSTALHFACKGWDRGFIALLLNRGADKNKQDKQGRTPLHVAAQEGRVAAVQALLAGEVSVSLLDENRWTPEDSARAGKRQHYEALEKGWNAEGMRQEEFSDATWAKVHEGAAVWDEVIDILRAAEHDEPSVSG